MPDASARLPSQRDRHAVTRALACLAASLAVVDAVLLLWPSVDLGPALAPTPPPREMVTMVMIEPTRQPPPPADLPPAPPPPPDESALPPVEVPDEVIVEDLDLDLPAPPAVRRRPARVAAPTAPPGPVGPPPPVPAAPPPASDRIVEEPDRSPTLRGQALPVYPRNPSVSGFRGRARVKLLVTQGGGVADVEVVQRVRLEGDREQPVAAFPPEFEAAVVEAARRYLFRPAREDGERVRAYAYATISLDPPE